MANSTSIIYPNKQDGFFLGDLSAAFESSASTMMTALDAAEQALEKDPSNPSILAAYQAKLQEYKTLRATQATLVKSYADTDTNILQKI
ncbi:EscF/YscF/HrpA family type III secretion system needle major subunit [Pantoea agglomerans]|uniref:EscF/YscF/HrpA family type III secretion system needle major subunit n=1 Tax=Enterobacter agglomerans TaxID=549 RepID=UPI0013B75970|nr:EscF/YscF/HrpA family type III secretion system needle major subunit [Pantoea agglomerans]NEG59864.1 EscF/YscF/HrpA family type III secretion system needle major subunit [Pantoea agglomerans]NEG98833.1 EscF/YscF/HrpA family type III secretion system needle major subunit [Pantoea agglomerans]NEH05183.1 EscF/YscF/HrpA family type III secretion system needle major subunit [Pantoea agglomerans]NEH16172.1 EscF/YscF/HrpA family type III secretion system needle major subunit [Pantoea agglomerans]